MFLQTDVRVFEDSGQPDVSNGLVDGVACGDVDNDGDIDLFLTLSGSDRLYVNQLAETGTLGFVRDDSRDRWR